MVTRFHSAKLLQAICRGIVMLNLAAGCASAAEVEAQLDRDSVPAGSGALMALRVSGSRSAEPVIPEVENLMFVPRGRSQQMQIVNGRTSLSVTYRYAVGSNTPGDYQIPPITVMVDGKAVKSCLVLALQAKGKSVQTIEGLSHEDVLDPVQKAFIENGAIQCGFCSPGMIMASKALLNENPHPSENDVRHALSGNLCRCTGYHKIVKAVLSVGAR